LTTANSDAVVWLTHWKHFTATSVEIIQKFQGETAGNLRPTNSVASQVAKHSSHHKISDVATCNAAKFRVLLHDIKPSLSENNCYWWYLTAATIYYARLS
jgi:hypothetical protein